MNPELEQELVSKHSDILKDYKGDPKETCLAFGIECGDGWYDIIDMLCFAIQDDIDHVKRIYGDKFRYVCKAAQIKAKYGSLCFYYDFTYDHDLSDEAMKILRHSMDRISGMVIMASSMSRKTCEVCGYEGKLEKKPFPQTLCDKCITNKIKK